MKSINNQTEYDDKLFYQTIISGFKKLFISPVKKAISYKCYTSDNSGKIVSAHPITDKPEQICAVADGIVILTKPCGNYHTVYIEHDTGIYTNYINIDKAKELPAGTQLKQGEPLGFTTDSTLFEIFVSPLAIFTKETKND